MACEYSNTVWRLMKTLLTQFIFGISESWDSNKDNINESSQTRLDTEGNE